jgi:predicted oxidoreductase
MYGNGNVESAVGEALAEWEGQRDEVYIVSKL